MKLISILMAMGLVSCGSQSESELNSFCKNPEELVQIKDFETSENFSRELVNELSHSVGLLSSESRKLCTVTAISNTEVVTANHCLDSLDQDYTVTFNYLKNDQGEIDNSKILEYKVKKIVSKGEDENIDSPDAMILELDRKLDKSITRRRFSPRKPELGTKLIILQHPRGQVMQVDEGSITRLDDRGYFEYDNISTLSGSSGASIFDIKGTIIGVHVRGGCSQYASGGNVGLSMKLLYENTRGSMLSFKINLKDLLKIFKTIFLPFCSKPNRSVNRIVGLTSK